MVSYFSKPYIMIALAFFVGLSFRASFDVNSSISLQKTTANQKQEKGGGGGLKDIQTKSTHAVKGERYNIFWPLYDMKEAVAMSPQLLSSPEIWIERLERRINWLDTVINKNDERSISERSQNTYFEFLKNYVSGVCYGEEEKSVHPSKDVQKTPLNVDQRKAGNDWTYLGDTMTGFKRLDSLQGLLKDVIQNGIAGDFIETGVWRGGSSIFARGVIRGLGQQDRKTFVCDSFAGLPPGERGLDKGDKGWDHWPYLEVSAEVVAGNFNSAGVLDENVIFAKGFFNDTIPVLSNMVDSLAIMRLDGDIYESTVDVLYHLYEKLSVGGYVIMDDWFGFPSKTACEDFFKVHGISPEIIAVDNLSAYWKKTENITVQFWRYEQNQFKQE